MGLNIVLEVVGLSETAITTITLATPEKKRRRRNRDRKIALCTRADRHGKDKGDDPYDVIMTGMTRIE